MPDLMDMHLAFAKRQRASKERARPKIDLDESHEQQALIKRAWYHRNHPELYIIDKFLLAIPNGANCEQIWDERLGEWRSPNRERLVREGMRPGVPDLFLALPVGRYSGFWLEMKSERGRLSDAQAGWRERLVGKGYRWGLYRYADDAWTALCDYVQGKL